MSENPDMTIRLSRTILPVKHCSLPRLVYLAMQTSFRVHTQFVHTGTNAHKSSAMWSDRRCELVPWLEMSKTATRMRLKATISARNGWTWNYNAAVIKLMPFIAQGSRLSLTATSGDCGHYYVSTMVLCTSVIQSSSGWVSSYIGMCEGKWNLTQFVT